MDKINDFFGKRKNHESFMQSVHILIILLYIGLRKQLQATLCRFSYLRCNNVMVKKSFLRIFVKCSLYKVLPD